ncbi:branched-chain amino acid transport system II carrier protein [Corynebacterium sp. sy039]|uniref:branched-chain amino acid transport system II carrier protein n=1 Tax=Corynebacterium sp. sy039 TaxID=2599641 RepID=UPI0011B68B6C|nr:branched-chain amino acid transport system II carrier protein [Corynebacterium sp. sy039]QDZ43033.1 branched-chain amino acid transport system II carrier protein [Corynebacterium sp. sy039]
MSHKSLFAKTKRHRLAVPPSALVAISLMLFSMFFGAGNLIFPPVVGAGSGDNFLPATIGFLIGAVVLPVIAIIAVALSGRDIRDLSARGGTVFSVSFAVATYLAIGAFYAIPRTGAVSFSMSITPVFGLDSTLASVIFNVLFFGAALALAFNPTGLVDHLGKWLTPALLVLLGVLIVTAFFQLPGSSAIATEKFAQNPLAVGLHEGYMTMDSLSALTFGILVTSALRHAALENSSAISSREIEAASGPSGIIDADDIKEPTNLVRMSTIAALISGSLLAAIYVGLAFIGHNIPDGQSFDDGAALLAQASYAMLGRPGQIVLGAIVLLACMTTAVGLLAATSEFFHRLLPRFSYRTWVISFSLISFIVASLGLSTVLTIAVPIISFLYPIAISIIFLTIVDKLFPVLQLHYGFAFAVWTAAIFSALSIVVPHYVAWVPLSAMDLGWIIPVLLAAVIGTGVDYRRGTVLSSDRARTSRE